MHDVKLLAATLEAVVVARPAPSPAAPQHLCADAGYRGAKALATVREHAYEAHIRSRGQEVLDKEASPPHPPRRWKVERSHSWFNRFRKLLVRFEKTTAAHEALLHLAAAIITWRQVISIYG